jgi:hypothetical protein
MSKGFWGVGRGDYFFLIVVQDIRNGFEFVSFDRVYFVPYYFRWCVLAYGRSEILPWEGFAVFSSVTGYGPSIF